MTEHLHTLIAGRWRDASGPEYETEYPHDGTTVATLRAATATDVDEAVEAAKIIKAAAGADRKLIADVNVFDVYRGVHLEAGKKSVAIEVLLTPTDKTLTDEDIEAVSKAIVAAVAKATGAVLRG